jgi:hypothetical protein
LQDILFLEKGGHPSKVKRPVSPMSDNQKRAIEPAKVFWPVTYTGKGVQGHGGGKFTGKRERVF